MQRLNTLVKLELKYCERCGGLWLRQEGTAGAYCASCSRAVAELPPAKFPPARAVEPECGDDPASEPPARRGRPPLFLMRTLERQATRPATVRNS